MQVRTILALGVIAGLTVVPAMAMESSIQVVRIGSTPTIPNGIVTPPQVVSSTYPAYTDEARNRRIEGVVTIEAAFDPAGNPTVVRIVRGLGYGLDENAAAILKDWRFLPATRNGDRVAVIAQVDVQFSLQNDWFRVGNGVSSPDVTERVTPKYPPEAKLKGVSGTVVLEVIVQKDGTPKVIRIVRSPGSGLDEMATQALEKWKFNPGIKDGMPVAIKMNVEVNFNLKR
jgi:TonB family protein